MDGSFFEKPILNSPYEYPSRHWELDAGGQPTNRILEHRRIAEFITPIPKPKKRTKHAQREIVFNEAKSISTDEQQYEKTAAIINQIREQVDRWRAIPDAPPPAITPSSPNATTRIRIVVSAIVQEICVSHRPRPAR